MSNADKIKKEKFKEYPVVTNFEFVSIVLVFSFFLYILFPGEKIFEYVRLETRNLNLTVIYLRNIVKKYPQDYQAIFSLSELYLKTGCIKEASETLDALRYINDNQIKTRVLYYANEINMALLRQSPGDKKLKAKLIPEIDAYYKNLRISAEDDYYSEMRGYSAFLVSQSEFGKAVSVYAGLLAASKTQWKRRFLIKELIRFSRQGNMAGEAVKVCLNYEKEFAGDDEVVNEILKLYLAAGKPEAARLLSIEVLRRKKII